MTPDQPPDVLAATAATARPSSSRRWFWGIAYTYVVLLAGTNLPTPLYQHYQHEFGFSPVVLTLVFASYVAALVPSLLVAGPASDAIGRKRVLLPALLVAATGSALFAVAEGPGQLFAARCAQGLAIGVASGALVASLHELEPSAERRRSSLVASTAPIAGIALAPVSAGLIAQHAPAPYVLPYAVEIVLLGVAFVAVLSVPESVQRTPWRPRRPQVPREIRPALLLSSANSCVVWAVTGLFLALAPSYVTQLTGATNLTVGGAVVTLMLGVSVLAQAVSRGREALRLQLVGLSVLVVGLAALGVASARSWLWLVLVAAAAAGVGQGLAFLGATTRVGEIAPPERQADVASTFLVATYLGTGLPVIGVGVLATSTGLVPAFQAFAAVVGLLCLALIAVTLRQVRASDVAWD